LKTPCSFCALILDIVVNKYVVPFAVTQSIQSWKFFQKHSAWPNGLTASVWKVRLLNTVTKHTKF